MHRTLFSKIIRGIRPHSAGQNIFSISKFSNKTSWITFDSMVQNRREQAEKSVLIQVLSGFSYDDLRSYCQQFGTIQNTLYYTTPEDMHFILVEFMKKDSVIKLLNYASYGTTASATPVFSPFLWFRAADRQSRQTQSTVAPPEPISDAESSSNVLNEQLQEADSVSRQMRILYSTTCLGELGSRLRFLTARQLEVALSGMFPHVRALPFGSSVNGFGRAGCDLDLVLQLGGQETGQVSKQQNSSRLVFYGKCQTASNDRVHLQRQMETLADTLQIFLPGCNRVVRILQARVPIIKFRHDITMLECDLSMTNMTALYMSELLFLLGEVDERVRPLVFCVRRWAQAVGLTNPTPGRWVSNFSLTLLVLFYLQVKSNPILPSINTLIQLADEKDRYITADGVNCTFVRDLTHFVKSPNEESLEELLRGFFDYYASFDFSGRAMSLVTAKPLLKPDHSPLYIENPLERSLNVSKNVSPEEVLRLQVEFRNASWLLEQQLEDGRKDSIQPWGILSLFNIQTNDMNRKKAKTYRIVQVKDLFFDNEDKNLANLHKSQKTLKYRRR